MSQKSRDLAIPGEQTDGLALTVGFLTTSACTRAVLGLDSMVLIRYADCRCMGSS